MNEAATWLGSNQTAYQYWLVIMTADLFADETSILLFRASISHIFLATRVYLRCVEIAWRRIFQYLNNSFDN